MTETIQTLKEDIAILQEKLQKLEELEMTLKKSGEVDVVSYDHKYYYRLSFGVGDYYWYKRYIGSSNLMKVEDPEEHRLVEELYDDTMLDTGGLVLEQGTWNYDPDAKFRKQEEVEKLQEKNWYVDAKTLLKSKEPEKWDVVRESKKWCEENPEKSVEDYLKPQTPEQVADGLKEAFREAVKQGIVSSVDKPKPMNEVLDRLENKYENDVSENKQKPKTLYDILYRWWMDIFCNPIYRDWDMETSIEDLVDRIEFWNMRIKNDDEVELDEQENDKNFKNSLDLIREWGEKNKPPTLTELLWEWWDEDWGDTKDKCIDMLVDIIGEKFIPPSNDTNGYEWEKCLKMMRDKLR
jgi:hypothetical protein